MYGDRFAAFSLIKELNMKRFLDWHFWEQYINLSQPASRDEMLFMLEPGNKGYKAVLMKEEVFRACSCASSMVLHVGSVGSALAHQHRKNRIIGVPV